MGTAITERVSTARTSAATEDSSTQRAQASSRMTVTPSAAMRRTNPSLKRASIPMPSRSVTSDDAASVPTRCRSLSGTSNARRCTSRAFATSSSVTT